MQELLRIVPISTNTGDIGQFSLFQKPRFWLANQLQRVTKILEHCKIWKVVAV